MTDTEKRLAEYMELPYTVTLKRDEEGDIVARVKELDGCLAHGQDEMEALGHLHDAKYFWLSAAVKAGRNVPQPDRSEEELPSGKFLARVPRTLHKSLIDKAKQESVSLNQLVNTALAIFIGAKLSESSSRGASGHDTSNSYGVSLNVSSIRLSQSINADLPLGDPQARDFFQKVASDQQLLGPRLVPRKDEYHEERRVAVG